MRDDLILDNLNLIHYMIHRLDLYCKDEEYYDVGLEALIKAADTFDPELGYAFSTYAGKRIEWALINESITRRRKHRRANDEAISLETVVSNDNSKELLLEDTIGYEFDMEEYIMRKEKIKVLKESIEMLKPTDREILLNYYSVTNPKKQCELAKMYHVTPTAISKRLNKIVRNLKERIGDITD